jgi:hypothetical protein
VQNYLNPVTAISASVSARSTIQIIQTSVPFFQPHPNQSLSHLSFVGEEEAAMELNILRMHIEDERKLEGV